MNKYIVTFSTTCQDEPFGYTDFELKQHRLIRSAKRFEINSFRKWTRRSLRKERFYKEHQELLDMKKGAGLWIWKPYIILEALKLLEENDFLVYSDTSLFFSADPQPLFDLCQENSGFYFIEMDSSWKLSILCKRDVFYFLDIDNKEYYNAPLTEGYFMIFQKNQSTLEFVNEWLSMCTKKELISDVNFSGLEQLSSFRDNRCDMPLLSILRLKHNIKGFRNPSQWGNHLKMPEYRVENEFLLDGRYWKEEVYYNSPYGTILEYDKEGYNCARPLNHYMNPGFIYTKLKAKLLRSYSKNI